MSGTTRIKTESSTDTGYPVDGFYNSQFFDRSGLNTFQAVAFIDILHIVDTFLFCVIHIVYALERTFTFGQQDLSLIHISFANDSMLLVANNLPEMSSLAYPVACQLDIVDVTHTKVVKRLQLPNGSTCLLYTSICFVPSWKASP